MNHPGNPYLELVQSVSDRRLLLHQPLVASLLLSMTLGKEVLGEASEHTVRFIQWFSGV